MTAVMDSHCDAWATTALLQASRCLISSILFYYNALEKFYFLPFLGKLTIGQHRGAYFKTDWQPCVGSGAPGRQACIYHSSWRSAGKCLSHQHNQYVKWEVYQKGLDMITDGVVLTVSSVFPVVESQFTQVLKNNCTDLSTSRSKIYSHPTIQDYIMQ